MMYCLDNAYCSAEEKASLDTLGLMTGATVVQQKGTKKAS